MPLRRIKRTRSGAEWIRTNVCGDTPLTDGRWRHIALIAETAADASDVMVGDGKAPSVSYCPVWVSKGKTTPAEPISAPYEQNGVQTSVMGG